MSLEHRTLIAVSGTDAIPFLQGQLTQDLTRLLDTPFLWSAHCSPKGRVRFTVLAWLHQECLYLDAPCDMENVILDLLRPFVLRSKVTLASARPGLHSRCLIGHHLDGWAPTLGIDSLPAPGHRHSVGAVQMLRLSPYQLMLVGPDDALPPAASPGEDLWALANLRQGWVEISGEQRDQFIPQWLNWDLAGGISFKKGCYTGQEIVARTHYLGKVTRRTRRFISPIPIAPKTALLSQQQTVGESLLCLPGEQGFYEILAVVQQDSQPPFFTPLSDQALHWAPFPYAIPA